MLRYPLKQEILLLVDNIIFIGTIIFAGKDSLTVSSVKKRIYNENGFSEIEIAETIVFDREKVLGFSKLEEEKELYKYYDHYKKDKTSNICDIETFRKGGK